MGDDHQALVLGEYMWIVVVGSFAAFLFGYGTGSNDVANAFGTSVGSKTLTLAQAVCIAIVFEFTGALVLGRVSQETISGGIADISAFQNDPEFFAYGMMWALLIGGVWQILASTYELNVSATHSIIGAVVGFAMAFKGAGAVIWAQEQVPCTGPLVFISPCKGICAEGPQQLMYSSVASSGSVTAGRPPPPNGKYLGGTFTVDIVDLYNISTGKPNSPLVVTIPWLMKVTGLNITLTSEGISTTSPYTPLSGVNATKLTDPIAAVFYVNLPGYGDPLTQNHTDRVVYFTLKTARHDGAPVDCDSLFCPIVPQKSAPVVPYQMMYETKAPFCTAHSNAVVPFPPYKGVLIIVLSWFFSPVLTGIASSILFNLARYLVLRRENSYKRSFFVLPFMTFLTFWINIYFVLTKGAAKLLSREAEGWTTVKAGWIAACVAGGCSLLSIIIVAPLLYHRVNTTFLKKEEEAKTEQAAADAEHQAVQDRAERGEKEPEKEEVAPEAEKKGVLGFMFKAKKAALHGLTADVFHNVEDDPLVAAIHKNAEVFDDKAEMVFSYMQVFSAICVIFAHGAGEVGYMSGPLGAIWLVIRSGNLLANSSPPIWTVVIGALGLVIGLATYGYQVTGAMGCRLAKLTPSRGFSAELATSLIIMIASQYGLPTSSSQCITGGIIGVALCEGKAGLNYKFFLETFSSWILTMIMMALITAFFFSQGAYAPSAQAARAMGYYEEALSVRAELLLRGYQRLLGNSGYKIDDTNEVFSTYLAMTITNVGSGNYYNFAQNPQGFYPHTNAPIVQSPAPWQIVGYLDTALALMGSIVVANPWGLMMCGNNTDGLTAYEVNKANFPWYKTIASSGPTSLGPCTGSGSGGPNIINVPNPVSPAPASFTTALNTALNFSAVTALPAPVVICRNAAAAAFPACNGTNAEQEIGGLSDLLNNQYRALPSQLSASYASLTAALKANISAAAANYVLGSTVSFNLNVPASFDTMPMLGINDYPCVFSTALAPPTCNAGDPTNLDAAIAIATGKNIYAQYSSVVSTALATLTTGAASFRSALGSNITSGYGVNAYKAFNKTINPTLVAPLTLATFVGPNPACPPFGATLASCPPGVGRFVDAAGKPVVAFNGTVDRLFGQGRSNTAAISTTLSMGVLRNVNGHVTLDQIRNANPGTLITVFGNPSTSSGTATCMQPPCNVAYFERPWFNGR